jgi:hypothetical protein
VQIIFGHERTEISFHNYIWARQGATPIGLNLTESNPYSTSHATTTKQKPEFYQEVKQYMIGLVNASH